MSQLKLNINGDLDISNNALSIVEKDDEIRQRLAQNLKTFYGEWFLDNSLGVPWLEIIFQKGTSPSQIEALLKDAILATKGIIRLDEFKELDFTGNTRTLNVEFTVTTENGKTITFSEAIP